MNEETAVLTQAKLIPPHCSARTPSGRRCRMAISDPQSSLCFKHAVQHKKDRDAANVAAQLIRDTDDFTSAVTINRSLTELYKLVARDEISPRRGAVMAYTCSLLLRTLPAINDELHPPSQVGEKDQDATTIIMDIPCAAAERARKAQLMQDPDRAMVNLSLTESPK